MTETINFLRDKSDFLFHTGNINNWAALKSSGYQNSAEELLQSMKLQLENWRPTGEENACDAASAAAQGEQYRPAMRAGDERDDMRITLKIFLAAAGDGAPRLAREALDAVCDLLPTVAVEQLIVALPDFDLGTSATASDEEEAQAWLDGVKPVWAELERLVADRRVGTIGVADAELPELSALYDWAPNAKPMIDHYNIDACCAVPPELQAFAKAHDIQLLTHNDPKEFPGSGALFQVCGKICAQPANPDCLKSWATAWAARYTIMIRKRSVISAKGYLVKFRRVQKEGE